MRYERPQLHYLDSGRGAQGNCANGTAAGEPDALCTAGGGVNSFMGYCTSGAGDANWCDTGTAAYWSSQSCFTGTSPDTTCATGGTPTTA